MVKIFVGYGFSLPLNGNFLNIQNSLFQQFPFNGRLKPYPTEFYVVGCKKQGLCPVGGDCYHTILNPIFTIKSWLNFMPNIGAMAIAPYGFFKLHHSNVFPVGFDGVVRGLHPTGLFFMPIFFNGALKTAPYGGFKC